MAENGERDPQLDGEVRVGLVLIVAALSRSGVELSAGILGGEFGYGAVYENAVFEMHPYCWCERDDCPWCANCLCPDSAYHHFVDGKEVSDEEFYEFFVRIAGEYPDFGGEAAIAVWEKKAEEANARRSSTKDDVCHWCTHPEEVRSNFYHPKSGTKVKWYKYIGRSMEIELKGDWREIVAECVASIGTSALDGVVAVGGEFKPGLAAG
jgi:hypothetical protein